jgi:hypothetical protein
MESINNVYTTSEHTEEDITPEKPLIPPSPDNK